MRSVCMIGAYILIAHAAFADRPAPFPFARARADSVRAHWICPNTSHLTLDSARKKFLIASHLDTFLAWIAGVDSTTDLMVQLDKRYSALTSDSLLSVDTAGFPSIGDVHAPVTIVLYVSSHCSLCKFVSGVLYDSVTTGNLKGKVRLIAKPFSLDAGDQMLLLAGSQGKGWIYERALFSIKTRIDESVCRTLGQNLGIDTANFAARLHDSRRNSILAESKAEGARNGIQFTPGIVINNHPYRNYKDPQWIIDAALYAWEERTQPGKK